MANPIGVPVVSAKIVIGEEETEMTIGQTIDVTLVGDAADTVNGKLVGIELGAKKNPGWEKTIYDGIPTSGYVNPVCGLIRNAADLYEVTAILLEMDDPDDDGDKVKHVRVNVAEMKTVSVS